MRNNKKKNWLFSCVTSFKAIWDYFVLKLCVVCATRLTWFRCFRFAKRQTIFVICQIEWRLDVCTKQHNQSSHINCLFEANATVSVRFRQCHNNNKYKSDKHFTSFFSKNTKINCSNWISIICHLKWSSLPPLSFIWCILSVFRY